MSEATRSITTLTPILESSGISKSAAGPMSFEPCPEEEDDAQSNLGPDVSHSTSSRHWRKIRSAVVALAAFRCRRVQATDFERIRLCGEGGSGLVYLVRLKNSSMYFALKVQRKQDLQAKERRIRRALIEREVLVTCAHPFVCSLYTAFQDTRHLYLLMDYCAGGDLASLIRNVVKRPLTEEEARFYISEIVAALEWIHLHGYVYRDLKPENVLIHESGHIRLGDFGTAERGSIHFSEKVRREEVESAIATNAKATRRSHNQKQQPAATSTQSSKLAAGSGAAAKAGEPSVATAVAAARARADGEPETPTKTGAGVTAEDGGHEEDEEHDDDEDVDSSADGVDLSDKLRTIVVQIDPLFESSGTQPARSPKYKRGSSKQLPLAGVQRAGFEGKGTGGNAVATATNTNTFGANTNDQEHPKIAPTASPSNQEAHKDDSQATGVGVSDVDGGSGIVAAGIGGGGDPHVPSGDICDIGAGNDRNYLGVSGAEESAARAPPAVDVGCGCGRSKRRSASRRGAGRGENRRKGGKKGLEEVPNTRVARRPEQAHIFSRGRGSVKLNVLLDSQTFIGTADFMAPEMVTGKERQGTAMDWWALGVMFYEITLGALPFNTSHLVEDDNAVFRSIVAAKVTFPRKHGLSAPAVDLVEQLLRKDPTQRLGERKGVGELKRHPFFENVHWALIANRDAPFRVWGPDSAGWAEMVANSSDGGERVNRDEKFATWTWQNTGDGKRPGVPPPSSQSQEYGELHNRDSLSMTSGTHQKVDPAKLARLGEELGIGVGPSVPPPPPELSVMAGRDDGEGVVKPASPAGTAADMEEALSAGAAALNNFSEDHSGSTRPSPALTQQQQQIQVQDGEVASVTSVGDGDGKGSHVVPTLGAEGGSSAKGGSGGPAGGASEAEGARQRRGAGRGGSGGSVSEVLSAGGGGDAKNGAPIIDGQVKIEEEERERRGVVGQGDQLEMSFQGYDFNTLRKVGSVRVQGMGGARLSMGPSPPTLARKSVSEGRT